MQEYIVCNISGLRSPTFESKSVLRTMPKSGTFMQDFLNREKKDDHEIIPFLIDDNLQILYCQYWLIKQNVHDVEDDIFKWILTNEKLYFLIQISMRFVLKGPIDNKTMLFQVMAWP